MVTSVAKIWSYTLLANCVLCAAFENIRPMRKTITDYRPHNKRGSNVGTISNDDMDQSPPFNNRNKAQNYDPCKDAFGSGSVSGNPYAPDNPSRNGNVGVPPEDSQDVSDTPQNPNVDEDADFPPQLPNVPENPSRNANNGIPPGCIQKDTYPDIPQNTDENSNGRIPNIPEENPNTYKDPSGSTNNGNPNNFNDTSGNDNGPGKRPENNPVNPPEIKHGDIPPECLKYINRDSNGQKAPKYEEDVNNDCPLGYHRPNESIRPAMVEVPDGYMVMQHHRHSPHRNNNRHKSSEESHTESVSAQSTPPRGSLVHQPPQRPFTLQPPYQPVQYHHQQTLGQSSSPPQPEMQSAEVSEEEEYSPRFLQRILQQSRKRAQFVNRRLSNEHGPKKRSFPSNTNNRKVIFQRDEYTEEGRPQSHKWSESISFEELLITN
ncbi:sporozoite surface protein 2-like [Agrilus planipennis]|uniref:Sporozoite surface protein 2-like n=1 Tax=Agrilus planipennis TaxID=224129 RepID=A0A1W4X4S0_AGRPL|nr:sporozoite surface protein 2-like [Agrilus planipennis]